MLFVSLNAATAAVVALLSLGALSKALSIGCTVQSYIIIVVITIPSCSDKFRLL
jgi:hypothetical protein